MNQQEMAGVVESVEDIGLDTIEYNISRFVQILRHLGVRVSLSETVDGMTALGLVDLLDRKQVKGVLRSCLVKNRKDAGLFDHAFNMFFVTPEVKASRRKKMLEEEAEKNRQLDTAEQELKEVVEGKNLFEHMTLSDQHLETYSVLPDKAKERIKDILEQMTSNPINNPGELINRVLQSSLNYWRFYMMQNNIGKVELGPEIEASFTGDQELDEVIQGVAAQFYHNPGDQILHKDLAALNDSDIPKMISLINHLSAQLSRSISRRYTYSHRALAVDIRKTVRKNVKYGGIPIELCYRSRRRQRPRFLLICDVSGSMAPYARFVLQFIYGLNNSLGGIESFIFSENVERITDFFYQNRVFSRSMSEIINWSQQWGKATDFHTSLLTFKNLYSKKLTPDTIIFIVSDGRTVDSEAAAKSLKELKLKSSNIVWLNPLPEKEWSEKPQIRQFGSIVKMYQCNTIWHLEKIFNHHVLNKIK
jgi:uncharacterized protein with von Willebrand factor type A (vWA) domain